MTATAQDCARIASERHFESHWGLLTVSSTRVAYFDNHPTGGADHPGHRGQMLAKIREALFGLGLQELSAAYYPESGEGQCYTFAMVVASRQGAPAAEWSESFHDAVRPIVRESVQGIGFPGPVFLNWEDIG